MRKEFVYSLAAIATVPVAANADPINVNIPTTQQLQSNKWSGDPTVSEGTVLVTEGASISQSVGTLKPGKYVLAIANLVSTDCALNVNFGGTTKTIAAASTSASLEFNLTSEQDVTITISSADAKSFQVTDVTLQLNYDFDATYQTFNDALIKVSSLLNQIEYEDQSTLLAEAQAIQKKIDEIGNAATAGNPYTDVYVKYALYGDDATNAIMNEIAALRTKGVNAVNTQYVKQLNEKLSEVYDGQSDEVKAIVKSSYDQIVKEINTFDNNNVVDDKEYEALLAKIDNGNDADDKDLKDKIRLANTTAANLLEAYNDVKAYIDGTDPYATKWVQSDGTTYGSAYDIYTDINAQLMELLANDRYKNILAAAQKELSLDLQKVTQAEKDNDAAYAALSYKLGTNEYGLQAKLKGDVDAAVEAMKSVYAKYEKTKGQLDAADAQYDTVNKSLTTAKKTHAVGLEVSQIKSKLTAAENAVQAVKDAIEAANVTTAQGKIDETMAALYLTSLVDAANKAINELNETAAPYTNHQNAITAAAKNKADLDQAWAKAKDEAAKYNYDGDAVSGYFTATINAIENAITALQTELDAASKTDGSTGGGKWSNEGKYTYSTTFYSSYNGTTVTQVSKSSGNKDISGIAGITSAYNQYKTAAKAAQDNYNVVVNSKDADGKDTAADGLKKLQEALNAADAKVKDLAIYNDQSKDDDGNYKYNYAQKVVDIQAKIDAVQAKITNAKKLTDYNHSTVMSGQNDVTVNKVKYLKVELDATIAADIKAIEDNYQKDNDYLEATLKAAMLAATAETYDKLVDDIKSLDGDEDKYGLSYEAINAGRTDIKTEEAKLLFGLDKEKGKKAIEDADATELGEIQDNIATIREKLDELLAVAEQAANKVKANNEAQAALEEAVYNDAPGTGADGNLDKYFKDNITDDALVKNATALADENVTPVKDVNKEMKTTLVNDIAKLKADITADRAKEVLDEKQADYEKQIADLKARIDAAKAKAEACTANYEKYQEYAKAGEGLIAKAQTALNEAVTNANAADAANADYKDKAFVNEYQLKITYPDKKTGATELADKYYKNGTMVANASTVQDLLDAVNNFAAGLEATAKANKEAYDELNEKWDKVKALWTSVSTEIAKYDESSAREGFQQELKAELDKLNKNKTDYEKNYGDIALPSTDRTTELASIEAAINDIKTRSLGDPNYSERIKADNDNMLAVIKATVDAAANEYDLDTDTLKMFKNVTSDVLTASLATVETQYNSFNNKLYKYSGTKTFVEVVNSKYTKAAAEYAATVSPDVFDKDSTYVIDIRADIDALVDAREGFMKAIREAIANETSGTISDYENQINKVIAELKALNGYTSKITDATAKAAVKTQSDNLAAAKDAVAAGIIPDIDKTFAALENLTAELTAAKFAAMQTKLDADIKLAEAYVTNGKEYLADDADNLAAFTEEAKDVEKARSRYNKANTAAKLTDAEFNAIETLIAKFKENGNNTYATILANNTAWPKIVSYVEFAQKELQTAIDGIQEYAAAGAVQSYLYDTYQTKINDKYDYYLAKYEAGTLKASDATDAEKYLKKSQGDGGEIKDQVRNDVKTNNSTSKLYTEEYKVIKENLSELEAEYNKFAAGDLIDITEANAVKAKIDNIKKALGDDQNTKYKTANTAAKLLVQQKAIAELMETLLNANYGEGVSDAAALAELQADLQKVKDTFNKDNYTEEELAYDDSFTPANVDLSNEITQLEATIAAIEAELEAGNNLSYNKENIANKIATAQKQATDIKTQADKNKANLDAAKKATEAAYAQLLTEIEADDDVTSIAELNEAIEDTKTELDKNIYATAQAASFTNLLNRLTDQVADQESAINEAKEAGVKQTDAAFGKLNTGNTELGETVAASLYDIKNTAADRELRAQAADLQAQFDAISYDEANYTLADQKSLAKQKTAIDEAINGKKNDKGEVTTNGLVQDIDAAKAQDYVLVNGVAKDPSDNTTAVTTSYVYLTANGKNAEAETAKVKEIQALIDALKKDIEDLNLYPEEQEPEPTVLPGDVTGSGKVDDADFDKFVDDFLAGNVPAEGDANFAAYDANGDGQIDIADVQAIFNLSMGLNADGSDPAAAAARSYGLDGFNAGTMSVKATKLSNGNTQVAILLNSTVDYRAFSMDLVMPYEVSVVSENADLQLLRSNDLGNIHRIVGYGQIENNGTMLTIELSGNGNVQFTNVVLATVGAKSVSFDLGNATGINTIAVDETDGNSIFDLGGKLMNGIKKGINIIRGKDGSAKKVVK